MSIWCKPVSDSGRGLDGTLRTGIPSAQQQQNAGASNSTSFVEPTTLTLNERRREKSLRKMYESLSSHDENVVEARKEI